MGLEASPKSTAETARPLPREALAQLERILASPPFRTSKRCSDLLRHVVHASCEGQLDFLKERTLGVAVFERDPDYDTNQDPVVRNTAGQVRKRLAQYYLEPGRDQELRIDLPAGAYIPQIYQPAARPAPPTITVVPTRSRRWLILPIFIFVAAVGVLATRLHMPNNIDRFWAPMLKQRGAIVLCVGQGHTYKLKGDYDRLFDDATPPTGTTIPLSDVVPIWDRSIGIHDAMTLVRLTALFSKLGHPVEFRGGRSTSLGDLRGKSTVLIGAFNNSWTLSLTGELRFYFDNDPKAQTFLVLDRQHPQKHDWEVRGDQQTSQDHDDYAIVSRVFNPTTEEPVIVAAGIQGGGTAAAGEFLTDPSYLGQALKSAPANWENRNVQFVLKTRLLGGTAGPPQLVASHYW
jgi:hypothetical protein